MTNAVNATPPATPLDRLTRDFLLWLAADSRTYNDVMAAWRTSCPRLSVWEDALNSGLIQIEHGPTINESPVSLTPHGRAVLALPPTDR